MCVISITMDRVLNSRFQCFSSFLPLLTIPPLSRPFFLTTFFSLGILGVITLLLQDVLRCSSFLDMVCIFSSLSPTSIYFPSPNFHILLLQLVSALPFFFQYSDSISNCISHYIFLPSQKFNTVQHDVTRNYYAHK